MNKSNTLLHSLLNSLGVAIYVFLVAAVMTNGNRLFGQAGNYWVPMAILLLLVLSVAVVGLLIFGRPVYLYLEGQKKEAWIMLFYTVGWLAAFVVIFLILLATVLKGPGTFN